MSQTVRECLINTSEVKFREMLATLEGVTEEQAVMDSRPDWPSHQYHVAQDGSIAGIVHHVAAWKQVFLQILRDRKDADPHDFSPRSPGFAGLVEWLRQVDQEWLQACRAVPEEAMESPVGVEGVSPGLTPMQMMLEMLLHEMEHLGQVNYLLEAQKCAP